MDPVEAMKLMDAKLQAVYATDEWRAAQEKVRAAHGRNQVEYEKAVADRDNLIVQAHKEYEEDLARG